GRSQAVRRAIGYAWAILLCLYDQIFRRSPPVISPTGLAPETIPRCHVASVGWRKDRRLKFNSRGEARATAIIRAGLGQVFLGWAVGPGLVQSSSGGTDRRGPWSRDLRGLAIHH